MINGENNRVFTRITCIFKYNKRKCIHKLIKIGDNCDSMVLIHRS